VPGVLTAGEDNDAPRNRLFGGHSPTFIDATLLAVNASEFFSQDLEDFGEVEVQENGINGLGTVEEEKAVAANENSTEPNREELLAEIPEPAAGGCGT
jgi:hypothetical protein